MQVRGCGSGGYSMLFFVYLHVASVYLLVYLLIYCKGTPSCPLDVIYPSSTSMKPYDNLRSSTKSCEHLWTSAKSMKFCGHLRSSFVHLQASSCILNKPLQLSANPCDYLQTSSKYSEVLQSISDYLMESGLPRLMAQHHEATHLVDMR